MGEIGGGRKVPKYTYYHQERLKNVYTHNKNAYMHMINNSRFD